MKYREGQVEYFGKKGMSLLGCMIVKWITKYLVVRVNKNEDTKVAVGINLIL